MGHPPGGVHRVGTRPGAIRYPPTMPNRLAQESSLYLRQHQDNPVDWHPWGPEALERARAEDRPLLVSIGYSACHWCHVMERESFEDPATAERMNALFVCIKVDREERPDVDQLYMDTLVRLTGHGGWPLTVFCTPDGSPFHAGTYFPPEPRHGLPSFRQVLEGVARVWEEERERVHESAARILEVLAERPFRGAGEEGAGLSGRASLVAAARRLLASADRERGGFGGGPKFPTPTNLILLLDALPSLEKAERDEALAFLVHTCREMARRGLYDQLGGGFHRYCVDDHWGVPHFEKMLYDQGQLMRVYVETWRHAGGDDDDLLWPVRETADWLRREMRSDAGAFFASQDADSEGVEGRFYVWTPEQVGAVLGEGAPAFCEAYAVTPAGNFEDGASVLWDLARQPRDAMREARERLLEARSRRVPPATDRKCVAAWNGLAISGLAHAGSLLGDPALLADAATAADWVLERLVDPAGRLHRLESGAASELPAFLDDVAAMLAACLDLHRAGAGERYLAAGLGFADEIARHFFDDAEGDLFLAPVDGERLVHRPRSDHDGATPHSAGYATLGLLRAATLSGREDLRRIAERVIRSHAGGIGRAPHAWPTLVRAAAATERGLSVAVVTATDVAAPEARALADAARRALAPEEAVVLAAPGDAPEGLDPAWLAGREPAGARPTAWLCRGTSCSLPVHEPGALLALARDDAPPPPEPGGPDA